MFKNNNKDTKTTSMVLLLCLYSWLRANSTHRSGVFIVYFKQVNVSLVIPSFSVHLIEHRTFKMKSYNISLFVCDKIQYFSLHVIFLYICNYPQNTKNLFMETFLNTTKVRKCNQLRKSVSQLQNLMIRCLVHYPNEKWKMIKEHVALKVLLIERLV